MVFSLLLTLGLFNEPELLPDLPINFRSGKLSHYESPSLIQSDQVPIDLACHTFYNQKKVEVSLFPDDAIYFSKAGKDLQVYEINLDEYGLLKFVKDSEYTYRPYFGQEYTKVVETESGVSHPENVEISSVGTHLVVQYLDGRKKVYKNSEYGYHLYREFDHRGFITEYSRDEKGVTSIIRLGPNKQILSSVTIGRDFDRENHYTRIFCRGNEFTYIQHRLKSGMPFKAVYKNHQLKQRYKYNEEEDLDYIAYPDGVTDIFSYTEEKKVNWYRRRLKGGDAAYHIQYNDNKTSIFHKKFVVTLTFTESGLVSKIERDDQKNADFTYTSDGKIASKRFTHEGEEVYFKSYSYDKRHNLVKLLERVDGKEYVTTYSYDDRCRKIKEVNHLGVEKRYSYLKDTIFPTTVEEGLPGETFLREERVYDDWLRVIEKTVKEGSRVQIERYKYSNSTQSLEKPIEIITSVIDPKSGKEVFLSRRKMSYSRGDLVEEGLSTSEGSLKIKYKYDKQHRLIQKKVGKKATHFHYDGFDRLIEKEQGRFGEKYSYGFFDKVVKTEFCEDGDPLFSEEFEYDRNKRLKVHRHPLYRERKIGYNRQNQILTLNEDYFAHDMLGRKTSERVRNKHRSFSYRGLGFRSKSFEDGSRFEETDLDEKGLKKKVLTRTGKSQILTFDAYGRLLKEECEGRVFTYEYDGRLITLKKGPMGYAQTYEYDAAGRLIKEKGVVCSKYKHDAFGNITYKKQGGKESFYKYNLEGEKVYEKVDGKELFFSYDELSRVSKIQQGRASKTFVYDCFSRIVSEVDYDGTKTLYEYGIGFKKVFYPFGEIREERFNEFGDTIEVFEYGDSGKVILHEEMTYDNRGLLLLKVINDHIKLSYEYNGFQKVIREKVENQFGSYETSYQYDDKRRLATKINPDGSVICYEYDDFGRLKRLKGTDSDYDIEYDLWGRETHVIDHIHGQHIFRAFDLSGNLVSESFSGRELTYNYEGGQRESMALFDGSQITYRRDEAGHLSSIDRRDQSGRLMYSHENVYQDGIKVREFPPLNRFSTRFSYNEMGRIVYQSNPFVTYKLNLKEGQVITLSKNKEAKSFSYDERGSLLYPQTKEARIVDLGGRISCYRGFDFEYDCLDRLISITEQTTGKKERFFYDFFGRLRKSSGEVLREYIYDGDVEIGSIVDRKMETLAVIDFETRRKVAIEIEGGIFIPLYDPFGHIRDLVQGGHLYESYDYDVFGSGDENSKNPWRFAGCRVFGFNQLSLFPNRAYCRNLKLFLTPDPLKQALHISPFHYCMDNPLKYFDEDGLAAEPYDISKEGGNYLPRQIRERLQRAFSNPYGSKKRFYCVNGLQTNPEYLNDTAAFMGHFLDQEIKPHYRKCSDSILGVLKEYFGSKKRSRGLVRQIKQDIADGIEEIFLFGHSAGGATINQVLSLLSRDERMHLNVTTFGSADIVSPSMVKSATNYYSTKDFLMCSLGFIRNLGRFSELRFISSEQEDVFMDHSIMHDTYRRKWFDQLAEISMQ